MQRHAGRGLFFMQRGGKLKVTSSGSRIEARQAGTEVHVSSGSASNSDASKDNSGRALDSG